MKWIPRTFCACGPQPLIYTSPHTASTHQGNLSSSPHTHPNVLFLTIPIPSSLALPSKALPTKMSVLPNPQNFSSSSSTRNANSKHVATIAVHVSTTVHTVIEPWSPGVPAQARSGKSTSPAHVERHSLTHGPPTVHIYAQYPAPSRVSIDAPEEGNITVSRVGVND